MNAYKIDAGFRIYTDVSLTSDTKSLVLSYRGNMANGTNGGGNYAIVTLKSGAGYGISHGWSSSPSTMTASISNIISGARIASASMVGSFEEFNYTIVIEDGRITHSATRNSGAVVFNYNVSISGLLVADVTQLDFGLSQTLLIGPEKSGHGVLLKGETQDEATTIHDGI